MAGLLDDFNYFGDNTAKDPGTGLTQADRRDPLWAGLIQGGMGLLAAGQDLTPAQRAQYIAQAGQTYGGIPGAMMAQKTAGAQQVLQQQQIKAGQSKLDSQARLAQLAKSPEFQAAVAQLPPAERALVQASLDAGDITHATSILSAASRERSAQAETLRREKKDEAKAAEEKKQQPLTTGQHYANLVRGQKDEEFRKSPEYALAWDVLQKPTRTADPTAPGGFSETPGLKLDENPNYKPPIRSGAVPPPTTTAPDPNAPAPAPGAPPTGDPKEISKTVPKGGKVVTDTGTTIEKSPDGNITTITDKAGNITRLFLGGREETIPVPAVDKPASEKAMTIYTTNMAQLDAIDTVLKDLDRPGLQGFGLVEGEVPGTVYDQTDPDGIATRASIANLKSQIVHDRSGASVTLGEMKILKEFLPTRSDKPSVVKVKLAEIKRRLDNETRAYYENRGRGVSAPPDIVKRYGERKAEAPAATGGGDKKWKIGDTWTDPAGRNFIVGPDGNWKEN